MTVPGVAETDTTSSSAWAQLSAGRIKGEVLKSLFHSGVSSASRELPVRLSPVCECLRLFLSYPKVIGPEYQCHIKFLSTPNSQIVIFPDRTRWAKHKSVRIFKTSCSKGMRVFVSKDWAQSWKSMLVLFFLFFKLHEL